LPPISLERSIHYAITLHIRIQLRFPEVAISFRTGRVLGASMPETAINEDSNSSPGKYDIGPSFEASCRADRQVLPKSQTKAV
jgi:hypothetical protein